LTQHFVRQLMEAIHLESIRHQTKVMNSETSSSKDAKTS
jgi:hypothetical protein